jgi:hypothetical protein
MAASLRLAVICKALAGEERARPAKRPVGKQSKPFMEGYIDDRRAGNGQIINRPGLHLEACLTERADSRGMCDAPVTSSHRSDCFGLIISAE